MLASQKKTLFAIGMIILHQNRIFQSALDMPSLGILPAKISGTLFAIVEYFLAIKKWATPVRTLVVHHVKISR
jgi:hypothetical protein